MTPHSKIKAAKETEGAEADRLPPKTEAYIPELKVLLIALRAMEKDPCLGLEFATSMRHTIMLTESSMKSIAALEARITALEKRLGEPVRLQSADQITYVSGGQK